MRRWILDHLLPGWFFIVPGTLSYLGPVVVDIVSTVVESTQSAIMIMVRTLPRAPALEERQMPDTAPPACGGATISLGVDLPLGGAPQNHTNQIMPDRGKIQLMIRGRSLMVRRRQSWRKFPSARALGNQTAPVVHGPPGNASSLPPTG